jgi:hypothetical protein
MAVLIKMTIVTFEDDSTHKDDHSGIPFQKMVILIKKNTVEFHLRRWEYSYI